MTEQMPTLREVGGYVGTIVSGLFLYVIGFMNLIVMIDIARAFRAMHGDRDNATAIEERLLERGVLTRWFSGVFKFVSKPWHMYPIGFLFGLGFDTATEVSLLVLAGGAAAFSLPWYAILCLPILFAAGMSLLDSIDGVFMIFAYGWAFSQPVRKIYYNIVITGLSVGVALVIGVVEIVSILVEKLGITDGPLAAIGSLDLNNVGFIIVGVFVLTWLVAVAVWYLGDVEAKWSQNLKPVRPAYGTVSSAGADAAPEVVDTLLAELPAETHVHADGSIHADGHGHPAGSEVPGLGSGT